MAVRASTVAHGPGNTLTVAWPTVSAGDRALLLQSGDGNGHSTTAPTGFTFVASLAIAGPDTQDLIVWEKKNCTGSETGSIALSDAGSGESVLICITLSGRSNSAALTFADSASNTTSNATPITMSVTPSHNALAGDDLISFFATDQDTGTDVWNFAPPSGGWVELQDDHASQWTAAAASKLENVGGGSVGTISSVATRTSGSGGAGWGAFIIAVPAAAAASTPALADSASPPVQPARPAARLSPPDLWTLAPLAAAAALGFIDFAAAPTARAPVANNRQPAAQYLPTQPLVPFASATFVPQADLARRRDPGIVLQVGNQDIPPALLLPPFSVDSLPAPGRVCPVNRPQTSLPNNAIGYNLPPAIENTPPVRGAPVATCCSPTSLPLDQLGYQLAPPLADSSGPARAAFAASPQLPRNDPALPALVVAPVLSAYLDLAPVVRVASVAPQRPSVTSLPNNQLGYQLVAPLAQESQPARAGASAASRAPTNDPALPALAIPLLSFFDGPPALRTAQIDAKSTPVSSLPPDAIGYNLPPAIENVPPARGAPVANVRPPSSLPNNQLGYQLPPPLIDAARPLVGAPSPIARAPFADVVPPALSVVVLPLPPPSADLARGKEQPVVRPVNPLPPSTFVVPTLQSFFDAAVVARSSVAAPSRIPPTSLPNNQLGYNLPPAIENARPPVGSPPATQASPTSLPPDAIGYNLPPAIENALPTRAADSRGRRVGSASEFVASSLAPVLSPWFEAAPPRRALISLARFAPGDWRLGGLASPILPPMIPSGSVLYPPTVNRAAIVAPFIASGDVVFIPTLLLPILVPFLPPASYVLVPALGRWVFPPALGPTSRVFEPTVRRRPDQIVALVDDFTDDVFDNSLVHRGGDGKLYLTPLQARDPRRLSLERLRLFISLLTFRREVAAGEEAGRAFRLRLHQIKIGQPYDPGDAATDLPSIAFLGGEGSTDTYGIGGISLIESSYGFAGPGTVVGRYGEYTEVFTLEVVAESDSKRQGLVAGLKQAFSLHVDSNTLRLLVPEAFDVVAEFELDSVQYLDEPSVAQNRFRARLGVRLTVPELFEVRGVARLKPFVQLLASEAIDLPGDPLRIDLRDDED